MHVQGVAQGLLHFFSHVGLPWEILTDRGATFTSALTKQLCTLLGICQIFTTIYHPQTDGLVERMNQTLKNLLCKMARAFPFQFDRFLDLVLFALQESPQTSTRVFHFKLVYGRWPSRLMQVMKDHWVAPRPPPPPPGKPLAA